MELRKIGNLDIGKEVRHAAFLSEDRVAVSTPAGDVFEVAFGDSAQPRLLLEGKRILKPVARALRQRKVEPAGGAYPRLAASPSGGRLIVNTHDAVLVACSLDGEPPRLIAETWGEYYPRIQFSPDGRWVCAGETPLLVFDVRTWKYKVFEDLAAAAWHPVLPRLLVLDGERRPRWLAMGEPSPGPPLGDLANGVHDPVGLFLTSAGDRGLAVFENGESIEFQLDPFRRSENRSLGNGLLSAAWQPSRASWIILESDAGALLWDLDEVRPLTGFLPGVTEICPSPSGRRLVLFERGSTNPRPVKPAPAMSAGFWEVVP
jgi:hypothetical protein